MKKCVNCNETITDRAKFCAACGTPQPIAAEANTPPLAEPAPSTWLPPGAVAPKLTAAPRNSAERLLPRTAGPQSEPSKWWVFGPLIALAILWPAYSIYRFNHPKAARASESEGATGSPPSDRSAMAVVQCQNYVRDRIRSPSTADFPWLDHAVVPRGNETYMVKSYVDAQNGFGATIRNDYICEIRYIGGDAANQGNWSLIDLTLGAR